MDIRIGLLNTARELSFETDLSVSEVEDLAGNALKSDEGLLKLSSNKGQTYLIPSKNIAYLEYGQEESRRIGFVS